MIEMLITALLHRLAINSHAQVKLGAPQLVALQVRVHRAIADCESLGARAAAMRVRSRLRLEALEGST